MRSKSLLLLILSILFSMPAWSYPKCENLFFISSREHSGQVLEKLARFWLTVVAEPQLDKKKVLRDEFEHKMTEYRDLTGLDPESGHKKFQEALARVRIETQETESAQKQREIEKKQGLAKEARDLKAWKSFLKLKPFAEKPVDSIELTPDGSKLIVKDKDFNKRHTQIWDLTTLTPYDFEVPVGIDLSSNSNRRPISGDGSTWFINMGNNDFKLIDLKTMTERPKPRIPIKKGWTLTHAALSHDGSRLLYNLADPTRQKMILRVYDLKNKKQIPTPPDEFPSMQTLAISPDGSKIFINSTFALRGFDLDTKSEIKIPIDFKVFNKQFGVEMKISPDGHFMTVIISGHTSLFVWDLLADTSVEVPFPHAVNYSQPIANTPWLILFGNGLVTVFDPETKTAAPFVQSEPLTNNQTVYPTAAITPDFKQLFVSFGTKYKMLNTQFEETNLIPADFGELSQVVASPDGSKFIGKTKNGELIVWFRNHDEAKKFEGVETQEWRPE